MKRKKIPRKAVKALMHACEDLSEQWGKPAAEIFKYFLELMNRYADYFFSEPWPEKYDYKRATTFTEEDVDFLLQNENGEFEDRWMTVVLKKNINLKDGFLGIFGMYWTEKAFEDILYGPTYKAIQESFEDLRQRETHPRTVLDKLKEKWNVEDIHDSLIDLIERAPMQAISNELTRQLIASMLELLHKEEGLPSCNDWRCKTELEELRKRREKEDE